MDLALGARTLVMAIVNATDDSFSGDGVADDLSRVRALGERALLEGADLIDVGAASSRPGHGEVAPEVERRRAVAAVGALADLGLPLSIDSTVPEVVEASLAVGAALANDVSGLRDPRVAELAAARGAWLVICHSAPSPRTAAERERHPEGVIDEVRTALASARSRAEAAGVAADRVILDPGLGFAKTAAESFALLGALPRLRELGPLLIGASRKRHLGVATARPVGGRTFASAAAVACAALAGAELVRVHDVGPMVDVARTADAIRRGLPTDRRVAYVGLGANLGDRRAALRRALLGLARLGTVRGVSGLWETAPQLVAEQPPFLNAVVAIELAAARPAEVVDALKRIEAGLGRVERARYGPREIDLDLLLFAGARAVERDGPVVVPHERLAERRFALAPLVELAPDEIDPRTGATIAELVERVAAQPARRIEGSAWWTIASS